MSKQFRDKLCLSVYTRNVIASFQHKGLKKMFLEGDTRYIASPLRVRVSHILFVLDSAATVSELSIPGFRLHKLTGMLKGTWSITVSGNWRITFRFAGGNAHDADLVDYH